MATGVECAGAVLGIIQFSMQLADLSVKKYRAYQGARKEVQYLRSSVSIFSQTLYLFGQTMQQVIGKGLGLAKDSRMKALLGEIRTMVEGQMGEIKEAFHRLWALGHSRASAISHFKAKLMWVIVDSRDMKELLAKLEPVKSTMNLLVNLLNYDQLLCEINQLRRENIAVPEDKYEQLQYYMAQAKMLKKDTKEKQRQYEAFRTISSNDPSNPFYDQTMSSRSIRKIVENGQDLAKEHISASRNIISDIGPGRTFSKRTKTGNGSRTIPAAPIRPSSPPRSAPPPPPPPSPRRHGPHMDERGSSSAPYDVDHPINTSPNPFESPIEEEMEARPGMVETAQEGPTASGPSGPNSSARRLSLSHSATVSNKSLPQEQPAAGPDHDTLQPEPPPRTRYRIVVRKGKMVPKEWRHRGADDDGSDSSASESEGKSRRAE